MIVDVLTVVLAAAALVVSIVAVRWARESARAGRASADAAEESLRWSRVSAEAAQTSASTAASAEAARVEGEAEAAVRWSVDRDVDEVSLRNQGPRSAYEVTVSLSSMTEGRNVPVLLETRREVLPGEVWTFDVAGHDEVSSPWVQVVWKLDPADELWRPRWRVALPPAPPRSFPLIPIRH